MRAGAIIAVLLAAAPAPGQDKDLLRLDFDEPQIVLAAGGRAGACDALRFADAGKTLLAVGDDKVVHSWAVRGGTLDYGRPLRWNVFRERRGAIYAVALSPDERHVAVAGYGRKDADVIVLDRRTGAVAASLSSESHPAYSAGSTVWSLAYSPTGDRIAVGQEDGSVSVWTPEGPGRGAVRLAAKPVADKTAVEGRRAKVVWVGFAGAAVRFLRGDGTLSEAGPGDAEPREVARFGYAVSQAVAPPDGRWLAAAPLRKTDDGSKVEIRSLPNGDLLHTLPFEKNERNDHLLLPGVLAADAAGRRLAVGSRWAVGEFRYSGRPPGDVRVFDLGGAAPRLAAVGVFDGKDGRPAFIPEAIAFHPDGEMLAVAGGADHETGLWKIAGDGLARAAEPSVGVARGVWQVGTRSGGTVVTFRQTPADAPADPNARGAGPWRGFDLTGPGWAAGDTPPDEAAVPTLNNWQVEISPTDEFSWTAVNGEFRYPLPFAKNTDDRPTCFTFLPGPDPRRTRLAVGHYWGFKLFELRRGFAPKLLARGVGHHAAVTSVAPARGGAMLVTGSADGTVGLWALQPWDHHPGLGAGLAWKFDEKRQERVFAATAVHAGGPAWEAGLLPGDVVRAVGYDLKYVENPAEWEATVAGVEPDRELVLQLERPGDDGKPVRKWVKTRLLTRPQARLFPTAGPDWVLYKYADYYYAASTNGDAYLGWQLSGAKAADAPEFHPAARFRGLFYRPDSVRDSLARLVREPTRPLTRTYLPPAVEVRSSAQTAMNEVVTLTITARPRADVSGKPVPLEKVELWLDDEVLLKPWPGTGGKEFTATFDVPPERLRVGVNRLTAVAYARTRGEASVEVRHEQATRPPPKVRGVAVGVDKYPYLSAAGQLSAAAADAKLIREAFAGLAAEKLVQSADVTLLTDAEATPAAILAAVKAAAADLGPDDWLVVFLAGHGFAELEGRRVKPGSWFFCGAAAKAGDPFDPAAPPDPGAFVRGLAKIGCTVPGPDLLAAIGGANCRKLVLLDACHSGAIQPDPGRDLRPDGRGAVVLTASAPDEPASEADLTLDRGGKPATERHGFFSAAVFHALGRGRAAADRNGDGRLTLEELHLAVAREVKSGRAKAGLERPGGRSQTVLACPPDLRNVVLVTTK